ncbi:hypothetical protein Droror1_Dr00023570 [Drosera rotundifolia]
MLSTMIDEKLYHRTEDATGRAILNFFKVTYHMIFSYCVKVNEMWLQTGGKDGVAKVGPARSPLRVVVMVVPSVVCPPAAGGWPDLRVNEGECSIARALAAAFGLAEEWGGQRRRVGGGGWRLAELEGDGGARRGDERARVDYVKGRRVKPAGSEHWAGYGVWADWAQGRKREKWAGVQATWRLSIDQLRRGVELDRGRGVRSNPFVGLNLIVVVGLSKAGYTRVVVVCLGLFQSQFGVLGCDILARLRVGFRETVGRGLGFEVDCLVTGANLGVVDGCLLQLKLGV